MPITAACQTNAWPIDPTHPETLFAALDAIRDLGFSGFETGFRNVLPFAHEPAQFKAKQAGLTFFGVHIFLPSYDPATLVAPVNLALKVARVGAASGAQRLILSGAPAVTGGRLDPAAVARKAEALNRLGAAIQDFGLTLAYHNHAPEFSGSPTEISALLEATDPRLVSLLLDAGHVFRAGMDIFSFLRSCSERVTGVHLRDFRGGEQVPLGTGDLPLQLVADTLHEIGWNGWVLAEEEREDGSKPGTTAVKLAWKALRRSFAI